MAKRKGSPKKGGAFEREFCKQLSLWWTKGKTDGVFWRTQGSGARATVRARTGKDTDGHYGDVSAMNPDALRLLEVMCFELKRGYSVKSVQDILDFGKGPGRQQIEEWLDKTILAHECSNSLGWCLLTRRDKRHAILWIESRLFRLISRQNDCEFAYQIRMKGIIQREGSKAKDYFTQRVEMVGVRAEEFFDKVTPESIVKIHKRHL